MNLKVIYHLLIMQLCMRRVEDGEGVRRRGAGDTCRLEQDNIQDEGL